MMFPLTYRHGIERYSKNLVRGNTGLLLIYAIAFIGLRDPFGDWRYLADTSAYSRIYILLQQGFAYQPTNEVGFYFLMKLAGNLMDVRLFYILCAFIYVYLAYLAFKNWLGKHAFYGLVLFITYPFFWAYGINALRSGLATSVLLYALSLGRKNWGVLIALFLAAFLIHNSVILTVIAFLVAIKISDTRKLIGLWVVVLLCVSLFGNYLENWLGQSILSPLGLMDERVHNLFADELDGAFMGRRFRLDFVIFSTIPIFLGYFYIIRKRFDDLVYRNLFHTYLIANMFSLFFIKATYSDRIVYLSWFLMPIILGYPLFKRKFFSNQSFVIYCLIMCNLAVTLILEFY